jgi:hypothetical protein
MTQVCSSSKRCCGAGGLGRGVDQAEVGQEVQRHLGGQVGAGLLEVLAAFGHHRHAVVVGAAMRPCWISGVPEPRPCGITRCTAGRPMASAAAALRSNFG